MKTLIIAILLSCLMSCSPKPSNEISEMALECFKQKRAIRIEFIPYPESKDDLDHTEHKEN